MHDPTLEPRCVPCSYCRNPDGGTSPWCCTEIECVGNTPGETWDYCDVCAPPAPPPPSPSPPPSPPPPVACPWELPRHSACQKQGATNANQCTQYFYPKDGEYFQCRWAWWEDEPKCIGKGPQCDPKSQGTTSCNCPPTPSPPPPPPTSPPPSPPAGPVCSDWCDAKKHQDKPWKRTPDQDPEDPARCEWKSCSGCPQCDDIHTTVPPTSPPPSPPAPGPVCRDWCDAKKHQDKPWKRTPDQDPNDRARCEWKSCSGCPQCD